MYERADESAAAVHLQIARRPDCRYANVEGEDGVVAGKLTDQLGNILRMDRLSAWFSSRELVQSFTRFAIISEAAIQMCMIFFDL